MNALPVYAQELGSLLHSKQGPIEAKLSFTSLGISTWEWLSEMIELMRVQGIHVILVKQRDSSEDLMHFLLHALIIQVKVFVVFIPLKVSDLISHKDICSIRKEPASSMLGKNSKC